MSPASRSDDTGTRVAAAVATACERIAPTWPLDQLIAVNPYWGWRSSDIADASARLGVLAGTSITMPRSWYRQQWADGSFDDAALDAAARSLGDPSLADAARRALRADASKDAPITRLAMAADVRGRDSVPRPAQTWNELIVHDISQHCASVFDEWQASWQPDHGDCLFSSWRRQRFVAGIAKWRRGHTWVREQVRALPEDELDAIERMLVDLGIDECAMEPYLTALLLSVNGWASWCAHRRWQARLQGGDDHEIVGLLAIRLAWDWLLRNDDDAGDAGETPGAHAWAHWTASWCDVDERAAALASEQRVDWVLHAALEHAYQSELIGALTRSSVASGPAPLVQAVFCIDVRSEVLRRTLESVAEDVQTRGFAGFFGLPIAYTPLGSAVTRPQLPGLLAPAIEVGETARGASSAAVTAKRRKASARALRWDAFRRSPSSAFTFVESMGLLYGPKLVKETLPHRGARHRWEHDGNHETAAPRPSLALVDDDPAAAAMLAARVLRAMSLVSGFAPLVLLCGHGAQSANNPQAAALDCGACGGQAGDINARVLAQLLNAPAVRAQLTGLGIEIPATTWFVPAMHNTTTDEVELFDVDDAPANQHDAIAALRRHLDAASSLARAERGATLGERPLPPNDLERELVQRANDWSQVRPEWGLAGNAAFVVAPRSRTRGLQLDGRVFLHDYDWRIDADLSTLTLIMTAPMIVTNWINMQYHASTVDNHRYGSGNKVLHNVVGGHIGVFEGNGGDLRTGLALQSLHDGTRLRHQPLRLSVFIEAPCDGIDRVIRDNATVFDLVANGWLLLFRIDPESGAIEQRRNGGWQPCAIAPEVQHR